MSDICMTPMRTALCDLPQKNEFTFRAKDKISALTHFIGCIMSIFGMPILLIYSARRDDSLIELISYGVFMLSMIALYGASAAYHSFQLPSEAANKRLKKFDHIMIFFLIAGTYTPVCVCMLPYATGMPMLIAVWTVAAAGILFKALWVTCPKWISSVMYICMGWICIFAFPTLHTVLCTRAFIWLLTGGIAYTIGGVIYALKLPLLTKLSPEFGAHELFHLFVMAGSFCHFMTMIYA